MPTAAARPDWVSDADWEAALQFADQNYNSERAPAVPGMSPGMQRVWGQRTPDQRYQELLNMRAAQLTPGGQYGNSEMANGLVRAGIIGTGIGSIFANLPGLAAAGAETAGQGALTSTAGDSFAAYAPETLSEIAPATGGLLPGGAALPYSTELMAFPEVGALTQTGATPGFFARMGDSLQGGFQNMMHNPDGSLNIPNVLKAVGVGATGLGMLTGAGQPDDQGPPPGWGDPGVSLPPTSPLVRQRTPYQGDYSSYGKTSGEHNFFQPSGPLSMDQAPSMEPSGARRGNHMLTGDVPISMYGKAEGGRSPTGRSDDIEALLSEGEYVMDAETVALLGDGSSEAGADRLDKLRSQIRQHKGRALAKGKTSPNAPDPASLLKLDAGGPVNPQLGVMELPPVNSNLPAPLPNAGGQYADPQRVSEMLSQLSKSIIPEGVRSLDKSAAKAYLEYLQGDKRDMAKVAIAALGPQVTQAEMDKFVEHFATKGTTSGFAKGGRTFDLRRIQNVRPRQPRLPSNLPEPTTGDRLADAARIRGFLEVLRKKMEPELPLEEPLKKKDGGAVKELKTFADKLEDALTVGDQPRLQLLNQQMEGAIPGSVELVKKEYAKGGKVSFSLKHILNTLMGAHEPTMTEQIQAQKMKDLNAPTLTDEQAIAYLRALDPQSPIIGQLQERRAVDRDRDILSTIREQRAAAIAAQRGNKP